MRLIKDGLLDVADDVTVDADHPGQRQLPDLRQLGLGELNGGVGALIPKSIALLQLLELDSDDAGEGGADQGALERGLGQPTRE